MGLFDDPRRLAFLTGGLGLVSGASQGRGMESLLPSLLTGLDTYRGVEESNYARSRQEELDEQERQREEANRRYTEALIRQMEEQRGDTERAQAESGALRKMRLAEHAELLKELPPEEQKRLKFFIGSDRFEDLYHQATSAAPTPKYIRMDLGDREVLIDPDTLEEVKSLPQGSTGSGRSVQTVTRGDQMIGIDPSTGEEVWSRQLPPKPESGRQAGSMTASQWFDVLQDAEIDKPPAERKSRVELAREAEALARGENPNLVPGEINPPSPQSQIRSQRREELGGSSLASPADSQGAPVVDQILSALPDDLRDTPGLAEKIQEVLDSGKTPREVLQLILEEAGRL